MLNKRFQNVLEICYMRCFIAPFCKLALQHLGNGGVVLHKQYFIHLSLSFPPAEAPHCGMPEKYVVLVTRQKGLIPQFWKKNIHFLKMGECCDKITMNENRF